MKYRKKPVVIEAMRFTADPVEQEKVVRWCGGSILRTELHAIDRILHIQTLEGVMQGNIGDYIIKGVKGEFYPCKPDIFVATYEPVE